MKFPLSGLALLLLAAPGARAADQPDSVSPQLPGNAPTVSRIVMPSLPVYPIRQFTLANGLKVVLSPDDGAPVIGLALAYNVGSRNEAAGKTGFAHLFEHMMFQGSAHVGKGRHMHEIESNGGIMNGFTRDEDTTYIETVPAEKLPLILWLEADRMRSLAVTAENLANQQEVVKEEKRLRYDNQPYVNAQLRLQELAFENQADKHSTIGSMADLDRAGLADVQNFFRTYYAPNNATLVLTGDFDPDVARRQVEKFFGDIPRQFAPPAPDLTEPPQTIEKRDTVTDPLAQVPALNIGYHSAPLGDPDHYALDLLNEILFAGESARIYQHLVKGKQILIQVRADSQAERGPSLFTIFSIDKPTVPEPIVEQAIYDEIDVLKKTPPSADELDRAKTRLIVRRLTQGRSGGWESMLGRAIAIADYATFQGDPALIDTELSRYEAVTPEQIQSVARKYFTTQNRTVVIVEPTPRFGTAPASGGVPTK